MPQIDLGQVVGPQGPKGDTGDTGPQGPQGPQGEPGVVDMDTAMEFTEAGTRANINSTESLKTILGKIKKYFTDLKAHAFNAPANNLTTTQEGYALDARQGKALKDQLDAQNSALTDVQTLYLKKYTYTANGTESAVNFVLPEAVSGYGYLPFIVVLGNTICLVCITGGAVSTTLSSEGVLSATLIGTNVTALAINENGKIRVKCATNAMGIPITILPLRQGITIENAWCSAA